MKFLTITLNGIVQDMKRYGSSVNGKRAGGNENKDTGYSSSSSSSYGAAKMSSLNCQNCTVLCNELKSTPVGSFCLSCYHHWRYLVIEFMQGIFPMSLVVLVFFFVMEI